MFCRDCIDNLVKEQASAQESDLAASVKELSSTFQLFKMLFEGFQAPHPAAPPPAQQGSAPILPCTFSRDEGTPGVSREEAGEEPDSAALVQQMVQQTITV